MDTRIIELKKTILEDNDRDAALLREETIQERCCYLNVMSSPGAGKTTTILALLDILGQHIACGVMEADIDSDVDARTIQEKGYPCVQLHTGGMCHLDAQMSRQGMRALRECMQEDAQQPAGVRTENEETQGKTAVRALDLIILENVGNLVCPAEFDTGSDLNAVILSVPEGDDKPLKYPLMFEKADLVIINKMDALPAFDFDMEKCQAGIRLRNAKAPVFPVSARTGEGIPELAEYLLQHVRSRLSGTADNDR